MRRMILAVLLMTPAVFGQTVNPPAGGGSLSPNLTGVATDGSGNAQQQTAANIAAIVGSGTFDQLGVATVNSGSYSTIELAAAACPSTPCGISLNTALTQSTVGTYTLPAGTFILARPGGTISNTSPQILSFASSPNAMIATSSIYQVFLGTGSITGLNGDIPVEWFGAIRYTTSVLAAAGTDSLSAIQKTITALNSGHALLASGYYRTTAAITINVSNVGIKGVSGGNSYTFYPPISDIVNTSTTSNIITLSNGTNTVFNDFRDFSIQRSVIAGVGSNAVGFACNGVGGLVMDNVQSMDSIRGFSFAACPNYGIGHINNIQATFGYGLVAPASYTAGYTMYGVYMDGATAAENTINFNNTAVAANPGFAATIWGIYATGNHLNDMDFNFVNIGSTTNGIGIVSTGSAVNFGNDDIKFSNVTVDGFTGTGILVSGLLQTGLGSAMFVGGYVATGSAGAQLIDVENSYGASFTNMQISAVAGNSNCVKINVSTQTTIAENQLTRCGTNGIAVTTSTQSVLTNNHIYGDASHSTVNGITFDTASSASTAGNNVAGNAIDTAFVTNPYVGGASYFNTPNCTSSASPAVCASSPTGAVTVAAAATTVTVNTTAVTANSDISLTFDSSLGTRLGVTCNTTGSLLMVSARTAGTSFTITTTAPATNPDCISYTILN